MTHGDPGPWSFLSVMYTIKPELLLISNSIFPQVHISPVTEAYAEEVRQPVEFSLHFQEVCAFQIITPCLSRRKLKLWFLLPTFPLKHGIMQKKSQNRQDPQAWSQRCVWSLLQELSLYFILVCLFNTII